MPMFEVVCKKIMFFETIYKLIVSHLHYFACKVNWDSKSRTEATLELVSMLMNLMGVSKSQNELPLEIIFFEVSSFVLVRVKL